MPARTALALAFATLIGAAPALAVPWRVDPERSSFAVLTHSAGVGARLGHDHLIVARGATTELDFDPADPTATRFVFSIPVLALEIDASAARQRYQPRLQLLGALTGELKPIADDDRAKIRASMLSAKQLFAERFPTLRVELLAFEPRGAGDESRVALGWNARVRVEIRGERVECTFAARWERIGDELRAEVLGELRFTDFGIQPYSALLGAIRNDDLFHLWVELVATPAADSTQ